MKLKEKQSLPLREKARHEREEWETIREWRSWERERENLQSWEKF